MKLNFEKWIDLQSEINGNKKEIFDDAISCFKAGIYRPALMLSYLGFLFILKDRFLNSNKPEPYDEFQWNNHKSELQIDSKWEEVLLNLLAQKEVSSTGSVTKVAPFNINDDVRNQIKYWKDRRNDCAHYKNNEVSESHVIAFWSFLKSKLSAISVEGSKQSLINKIIRFYDPSYTPENADITPLISNIEVLITGENAVDIFKTISGNSWMKNNPFEDYFYNLKIQPYLIKYFQEDRDRLMRFLTKNPNKIQYFLSEPEEIRNFWKKVIALCDHQIIAVYAEMLIASMLPSDQIEEANFSILQLMYKAYSINWNLPVLSKQILINSGFYKQLIERYWSEDFFNSNLKDANYHLDFYLGSIRAFEFNNVLVKNICNHVHNGTKHPYALRNGLIELLQNNEILYKQFKDIATQNSIELPEDYKF